MNSHRCWVEVDGRALRHNIRVLRHLIPPGTRLMAVVKANAYGHGLVPVAREFLAAGVDGLGVANISEGASLREAGMTAPILVLSATLPEEMEEAIRHDLALTISSFAEARQLDRRARALNDQATVHFKIDTGMGRLGCWHEAAAAEMQKIQKLPGVQITGLCTHFASADDHAGVTKAQWKLITPFFAQYPSWVRHASNSPAVLRRYGFTADMVRAGLALYGLAANVTDQRLGLRPALTWKSRITLIREVAAGRTVSYGGTYRTRTKERHATIAMGYGDGYMRLHSNWQGTAIATLLRSRNDGVEASKSLVKT